MFLSPNWTAAQSDLNNLLDASFTSNLPSHSQSPNDMSFNKSHLTSQQATAEQGFQEIMKQIHELYRQREILRSQREQNRNKVIKWALQNQIDELKHLDEENAVLRKQYGIIQQQKILKERQKSQKLSTRSPFKPRSSMNTLIAADAPARRKLNKQNSSSFILKKQKPLTESTSNLFGRNSMHSPRPQHGHKRRQSQLTERKDLQNVQFGLSVDVSFMDDRYSQKMRESFDNSKQKLRENDKFEQPSNIFVGILQKMLIEEQLEQKERYAQLDEDFMPARMPNLNNIHFVNELEQTIQQTQKKLSGLSYFVKVYQADIEGMNIDLKIVEQAREKLWKVKGKFIEMEKRCANLHQLRAETKLKEEKLRLIKSEAKNQESNDEPEQISSIETLLKVFSNGTYKGVEKTNKKLSHYYRQIKQIFKFQKTEKVKFTNRNVKVKELIESIREGRKKFSELVAIYNQRIQKLEEKIVRVKQQNERVDKK